MIYDYLLTFTPFFFLIGCWLSKIGNRSIVPISQGTVIFFLVAMTICMGLYPIIEYSDKERYYYLYMSIYNNIYWEQYKDSGWQTFVTLCTKIMEDNYNIFFIFVSFIYTFSYYIFAKHQFGEKYMGYFIIMAFGCLGFTGYGTNTIRSGVALGMLLLSLSFNGRIYLRILLAILSVTIHMSMILPIGIFLITTKIKKDNIAYAIWLICFVLSVFNLDLSSLMEELMFVDQRVDTYTNMIATGYNKGYRIDFLIYSVFPIIVSYYYKKLGYSSSQLYTQLYRTYIITNGLWLLVIRMAFTNRIAYLSWMIIPYIVLYPIIEHSEKIKNPQKSIYRVMALFMSVSLILSIRDLFFR